MCPFYQNYDPKIRFCVYHACLNFLFQNNIVFNCNNTCGYGKTPKSPPYRGHHVREKKAGKIDILYCIILCVYIRKFSYWTFSKKIFYVMILSSILWSILSSNGYAKFL